MFSIDDHMKLRSSPALLIVLAFFVAVGGAPSLSEWRAIDQTDTMDIFHKDHVVGTLVHRIFVADSIRGITSTMSMSVAGKEEGVSQMEAFDERVYNINGKIRSAREIIKSSSGTNTWALYGTPQGWRLSVEAGGETSASIIDSVKESLVPTLELTTRVKKRLIAKGETWRDTQIDLVSGRLMANVYTCTAVDSGSKSVTFDVADNITGRHQAWQLDESGKTLMQEIEGIFVAKKATPSSRRKRTDAADFADLGDILSVAAPRAALAGEKIAVELPADASMNQSVAGMYVPKGGRWLLNLQTTACSCNAVRGAFDTSLAEFTRPTATLQCDHPSISHLAQKIRGAERDPCSVTVTLTKYVFSSLESGRAPHFPTRSKRLKPGSEIAGSMPCFSPRSSEVWEYPLA